jgi:hypothetical protein
MDRSEDALPFQGVALATLRVQNVLRRSRDAGMGSAYTWYRPGSAPTAKGLPNTEMSKESEP